MNTIKILNVNQNGKMDYKGLDVSKIVAGSQLYPSYENVAYFLYNGDVTEGGDIQIVNQETYDTHKQRIEKDRPVDPLEEIRQKQVLMQKAIDDLIFGGAL